MDEYKLQAFWNDIPTTRAEAVPYSVLQMWWNMTERGVRKTLHDLSSLDNGDNYILVRSSKSKGFYKTDNKDEIERYKQECLNKGRSIFAPIKKINRILQANADQYSLHNNLRVVRESRNLKQSSVCAYMRVYDEAFDVPMLSKMENGVCLPTPYQLGKLAEFYGCEPSELVTIDFYY